MTDEQWVWLYVNQVLDDEDKLNHMCDSCRDDVTSDTKCIRCGKPICVSESFTDPNFDMERYEKLAHSED